MSVAQFIVRSGEDALHAAAERVREPAYEPCPSCAGSGLALNTVGEPDTCPECHGNTVVRARSTNGRFR